MRWRVSAEWSPPELRTPRLVLRALAECDAESVFAYASDPEVARHTLWEPHRSVEETLTFIRYYAFPRYRRREPEPFAITLADDAARVIGTAGCFWVAQRDRVMELGYALARSHWGRGLAAEAADAVLDFAFADYSVERMQARCLEGNAASMRVLEKLGFRREGVLRSAVQHRGRPADVHMFSLLRGEWEGRARAGAPGARRRGGGA